MRYPKEIETTLYIVRHGETDYNRNHIVQGRGVDVPLNQTGVTQAKSLAKRLEEAEIDTVYSSTLLRAKQTAKVIAKERDGDSITLLSDLEEMSWGVYEGMSPTEELRDAFNAMKHAWQKGDFEYRIEGGETVLDVQKRGVSALNYIIQNHKGERVLIVSHGRFIRVLLATILDEYGLMQMGKLKQDNTAFNHVVYRDGQFHAEKLKCTSHLKNIQ